MISLIYQNFKDTALFLAGSEHLFFAVFITYVTQPHVKNILVGIQLGLTFALRAYHNLQITLRLDLCNLATKYADDLFMFH